MICHACGEAIDAGEEREHLGRTLCENCLMDALSPPKACDPWAVYTAGNIPPTSAGSQPDVTDSQQKILDILEKTGGIRPEDLFRRIGGRRSDVERDLAALRHMEKIRSRLFDGERRLTLW